MEMPINGRFVSDDKFSEIQPDKNGNQLRDRGKKNSSEEKATTFSIRTTASPARAKNKMPRNSKNSLLPTIFEEYVPTPSSNSPPIPKHKVKEEVIYESPPKDEEDFNRPPIPKHKVKEEVIYESPPKDEEDSNRPPIPEHKVKEVIYESPSEVVELSNISPILSFNTPALPLTKGTNNIRRRVLANQE